MKVVPLSKLPLWSMMLLPLGAALLVYAPTLAGGFLGDDFVYVARFGEYPWKSWPRLFVNEWSDGVWGFPLKELRPFAALSYLIDANVWGASSAGWRTTNLLLFLSSTALVVRITQRYTPPGSIIGPMLAGLVFALHPVQVEAVAWITGRVDLLACTAALLFWHLADTYLDKGGPARLAGAAGALFVGVFSKEFCLLAPLLVAATWTLPRVGEARPRHRFFHVGLVVITILLVYALCRHIAFGSGATSGNANWTTPDAWRRQASYLGWLLPWLPYKPALQWPALPAPETIRSIWLAAAGVVVASTAIASSRRFRYALPVVFFSGIWWLVTVGGLIAVGYFSPRHLHFPSVGLAMAAGIATSLLPRPRWSWTAATALAVWCSTATISAASPWIEAGRISRKAVTSLESVGMDAPTGSLLALTAPSQHHTAWLWAWSAPALADAPFVARRWSSKNVLYSNNNAYHEGWETRCGPFYAERVAQANHLVVLAVHDDGHIACRLISGASLTQAAAALASLSADGLTNDEWNQWVQQTAQP